MSIQQNQIIQNFEKGYNILNSFKELPKYINEKSITAGAVAAIFGCTGPCLLVIKAAMDGGLTNVQTVSWLFSIYVIGGLISIFLSLKYKQPIAGAFNIPAAVMLATILKETNLYVACGAYFVCGIILFLLGISGLIGKVMRWIPLPIVMAMIAGAMIKFGTGIIISANNMPVVGLLALVGFFVIPKISKKIPPVLGALILGMVGAAIMGVLQFESSNFNYVAPQILIPEFDLGAILSISIPLSILIIGSENAQAIGVLMSQEYRPPINVMTMISGIGTLITAFFGGHNGNIAGPMTAICASEDAGDNKDGRYAASFINGVLFVAFGLIASIAMAFVTALPASLINIIAGLAMVNVLCSAFKDAFSTNKFKIGSFFSLVIAMSGITVFKLSAPLLALIGGVIVSLLVESKDFRRV